MQLDHTLGQIPGMQQALTLLLLNFKGSATTYVRYDAPIPNRLSYGTASSANNSFEVHTESLSVQGVYLTNLV